AFSTTATPGLGLDNTDETSSPVGLGEYEIPPQDTRGIWMGLSMDVDKSGGARDGRIYIAFADQGDLDGLPDAAPASFLDHHDTDIFILASDSGGMDWNALAGSSDLVAGTGNWLTLNSNVVLVRVNDDPGTATQFFSWLDVDDSTGNVAVSWYDTRNDTGVGG